MLAQSEKNLCVSEVEEQELCEILELSTCRVQSCPSLPAPAEVATDRWERGRSRSWVMASSPAHQCVPGAKRCWPNLVSRSRVAPLTVICHE